MVRLSTVVAHRDLHGLKNSMNSWLINLNATTRAPSGLYTQYTQTDRDIKTDEMNRLSELLNISILLAALQTRTGPNIIANKLIEFL